MMAHLPVSTSSALGVRWVLIAVRRQQYWSGSECSSRRPERHISSAKRAGRHRAVFGAIFAPLARTRTAVDHQRSIIFDIVQLQHTGKTNRSYFVGALRPDMRERTVCYRPLQHLHRYWRYTTSQAIALKHIEVSEAYGASRARLYGE